MDEDPYLFVDSDTLNEAQTKISSIFGVDLSLDRIVSLFDYSSGVEPEEKMKLKPKVEALMDKCLKERADALFLLLGHKFLRTESDEVRSTICSLLRNPLVNNKGRILNYLAVTTKSFIKASFLHFFKKEDVPSRLDQEVSLTMAALINSLPQEDKWEDLDIFVHEVKSAKLQKRLAKLLLFICYTSSSPLLRKIGLFHVFWERTISLSSEIEVRLESLDSFLTFLKSVSVQSYPQSKSLVPVILKVLKDVVGSKRFADELVSLFRIIISLGTDFLELNDLTKMQEWYNNHMILTSRDPRSLELIFSDFLIPFEALIEQLNSNNNVERYHATNVLQALKENHLEKFTDRLVSVIRLSDNVKVREIAATYLYNHLNFIIPLYDEWQKTRLQDDLRNCLRLANQMSMSQKISLLVSKMALHFNFNVTGHIRFILDAFTSGSANFQISAVLLLSDLFDYNNELIAPHLSDLFSVLQQALSPPSPIYLRLASLPTSIKAIPRFFGSIETSMLRSLGQTITLALHDGLAEGDVSNIQKCLVSLNDMAVEYPNILKEEFYDLVLYILHVTETQPLEPGSLNLSLELLITFLEGGIPDEGSLAFKRRLVVVLLQKVFALVIAKAPSSEVQEYKRFLKRVAKTRGKDDLLEILSELLPEYFSAPEWEKQLVALTAIIQMVKELPEENVGEMVIMVTKSFVHENPKIQYAAINATLTMIKFFGEKFQVLYGQHLMEALEQAMDNFKSKKAKKLAQDALQGLKK